MRFSERMTMLRAFLATIAVLTAMVAGPATPAQAQGCAAHLAEHGTTKEADILYHSVHGGESPCKDENNGPKATSGDDKDYRTSRWEDKTSFDCGWSWRGGFGC